MFIQIMFNLLIKTTMKKTKKEINRNVPDSDARPMQKAFWKQKWINPISGFEERIYKNKNEPTKHFNYEH